MKVQELGWKLFAWRTAFFSGVLLDSCRNAKTSCREASMLGSSMPFLIEETQVVEVECPILQVGMRDFLRAILEPKLVS